MSCISKSKYLSLKMLMRNKIISYLQVLANASSERSVNLIDQIDSLILERENYKKLCGSNNKPTLAAATAWLEMWQSMFKRLEDELKKEVLASDKLNTIIKRLLEENISLVIEKDGLIEDTIMDINIKEEVRAFIIYIYQNTNVSREDIECLLKKELNYPEMSLATYEKYFSEYQNKISLDSISGYLVLEGFGAYLGEIVLKDEETFKDFLASNPYYQELMSKGAVLIIGPNITNLIGEECVYCANYEEMNELGILRKSEEETL